MTARGAIPASDSEDHDRHAERVAAAARQEFDRNLAQLVPDPQREQEIEEQIKQRERTIAAARAGLASAQRKRKRSRPEPTPERSTGTTEDLTTAHTLPEIMTALAHAAWTQNHQGEPLASHRIPTVESLAEWLGEMRETTDALDGMEITRRIEGLAAVCMGRADLVATLTAPTRTPKRSVLTIEIDPEVDVELPVLRDSLPAEASELGQTITEVHGIWREYGVEMNVGHPYQPMVEAWQVLAPVPARWDGRDHPVLPGPLATVRYEHRSEGDQAHLPFDWDALGAVPVGDPDDQAWLPGLAPEPSGLVPSLPLILWDAAGGMSLARGRGAPLALRLWVEAMLAVPNGKRHWRATRVTCTLRDLVEGLWPNGSYRRSKDLPKLVHALRIVDQARIPWDDGRSLWRTVSLTSVPRDMRALDTPIVFDVSLPPGSGQGPLIHRPTLRRYGVESAPAYRAYLSLCWYWDHYGTVNGSMISATLPEVQRDKTGYVLDARGNVVAEHGNPTRRATHPRAVHTGRREANPAVMQYPVLISDDLVRMCYPEVAITESGRRSQALRARETLEAMQHDGIVHLIEAVDASGKRGVRVPVADAHRERHEALKTVRERRRQRRSTGDT